jgi:microcystin-dependent protein
MHWIDGANNVPNKFGPGEHGFSEGNPNTGVRGTILTAKWLDDLQRNLVEVIKRAGTGMTDGGHEDLFRAIEQMIDLAIPNSAIGSGTILMFGGASAPSQWLLCNGAEVNRSAYQPLFDVIGTTYGIGNGTTTFNLPDLRGRVAIGAGQGQSLANRALASKGGEEAHILTVNEMPTHTHNLHAWRRHISGNDDDLDASVLTSTTGLTGYIDPVGGGIAHNTMPPYLTLNFIIKT